MGTIVITDAVTGQTTERAMTPEEVVKYGLLDSDGQLAEWRNGARLHRGEFCTAIVVAGILPKAEAIDAAKGNWPATFAAALDQLSEDEKFAAQIEWAATQTIRRNHPLIAMLAGVAQLSDAQVDALFGWGG